MELSTFQFTKKIINDAVKHNNIFARKNIKTQFREYYGSLNGINTVYVYLGKFIRAGLIEVAKTPGFYIVNKELADDLTATELDALQHANKQSVKKIIPNVDKKGGKHYKQVKVEPIELICKCELTFLQGNIVKYITRYPFKNGVDDILKAQHYAEYAIKYNEKHVLKPKNMKYVHEYCTANNLTDEQSTIIGLTIRNEYKDVIDMCDELINAQS